MSTESTDSTENTGEKPPLDKFTRNYIIALGVAALLGLGWWMLSGDDRVDGLNAMLESDSELAAYPYTFRVLSLENGIAAMSSPRSAQMPAMQFLRATYPELRNSSVQDAEMMEAQDVLAHHQARAAKLVSGHPDVSRVQWILDERWFSQRGIPLP